jgi:hypothetical protein
VCLFDVIICQRLYSRLWRLVVDDLSILGQCTEREEQQLLKPFAGRTNTRWPLFAPPTSYSYHRPRVRFDRRVPVSFCPRVLDEAGPS